VAGFNAVLCEVANFGGLLSPEKAVDDCLPLLDGCIVV